MQLEAGKYYINRKGEKIGPLEDYDDSWRTKPKAKFSDGSWTYKENGEWAGHGDSSKDLVSELKDVELFETKKFLKDSDYGEFEVVTNSTGQHVNILPSSYWKCNSEQLRQLANQLIEIADYWDEE